MRRWSIVMLATVTLLGSGCGAPAGQDVVERAGERLTELRGGRLELAIEVSLEDGAGRQGFRVSGPFSFPEDAELPEAELEWTRITGEREDRATLVTDGRRAVLRVDGVQQELTDEQADLLRQAMPSGEGGGLALGRWLVDAEPVGQGGARGRLDIAAVVEDLSALMSGVGGQAPRLEQRDLVRLEQAAEVATWELRVDEQGGPRAFDAELLLAADDLPGGLRPVRFLVRFRLEDPSY